jgi:hypothetical protein
VRTAEAVVSACSCIVVRWSPGTSNGCCPGPEPDASGRIGRHLIYGHEQKNATDEYGNHHSAGRERDVPWVAITPVVNAIHVLERMVEHGELLFSHAVHGAMAGPGTGSLRSPALRVRIEDFAVWANAEAARHCLPGEVIPPDQHGAVGTRRFRRTWHIARRPGGSSPWPSGTAICAPRWYPRGTPRAAATAFTN